MKLVNKISNEVRNPVGFYYIMTVLSKYIYLQYTFLILRQRLLHFFLPLIMWGDNNIFRVVSYCMFICSVVEVYSGVDPTRSEGLGRVSVS